MLPWAMIPLAGLLKLALITKNRKPIRFSTSGLMVLSVVNLLAFVWYW
jgi:hypothetical protein